MVDAEDESETPHAIHVQGDVDLKLHAFREGERLNIEQDGDVFEIEGTGVTLVAMNQKGVPHAD